MMRSYSIFLVAVVIFFVIVSALGNDTENEEGGGGGGGGGRVRTSRGAPARTNSVSNRERTRRNNRSTYQRKSRGRISTGRDFYEARTSVLNSRDPGYQSRRTDRRLPYGSDMIRRGDNSYRGSRYDNGQRGEDRYNSGRLVLDNGYPAPRRRNFGGGDRYGNTGGGFPGPRGGSSRSYNDRRTSRNYRPGGSQRRSRPSSRRSY